MRLTLARLAGTLASLASRTARRGRGETLRGRVILAVEPQALRILARKRDIVLVSGTNGKTTTTALVAKILAEGTGEPVASSVHGANMLAGVAAVLSARPAHRLAVIECDELYVPRVYRDVAPKVVVLLNLSRDQLHRTGEVRKVAQLWHDTFVSDDVTLIIDRDDPFLEYAAANAGHVIRVTFGGRRHPDAATCPACARILDWSTGDYRCECGLGGEAATVRGDRSLSGPGRNAVLAIEAARLMGASIDAAAAVALAQNPPDRSAVHRVGGINLETKLAKNPASWRGALESCGSQSVILAVNARGIDGRDTSWLWDVDFSALRGREVVCTGDRRLDVAYRLHVQGIDVRVADSVAAAVAATGPDVTAIASYTAFQDLAAADLGISQHSGGRR